LIKKRKGRWGGGERGLKGRKGSPEGGSGVSKGTTREALGGRSKGLQSTFAEACRGELS